MILHACFMKRIILSCPFLKKSYFVIFWRLLQYSTNTIEFWYICTIGITDWESTKPHLCSKLPLFKRSRQMLDVKPQLSHLDSSLPYLRPFQWGTVWPYTSSGIKNTTGQSWKFNFYYVNLDFSTLTCHIFDATWGIGSYSTSLERSQIR